MLTSYCLEVTFAGPFHDKGWLHCHLEIAEEIILLKIYCDDYRFDNNFMMWVTSFENQDRIAPYSSFKIADNETKITGVNFQDSRYTRMSSYENDQRGQYFSINLDQVTIYKKPSKNFSKQTASIFLNNDGFNLVKGFYSIFFPKREQHGTFDIQRMDGCNDFYKLGKSSFRPEFEFNWSDKRDSKKFEIVKVPILKFKLLHSITEKEAIDYFSIACSICSFYLGNNIEYSKGVINLKEKTIIINKVIESKYKLSVNSLNFILDGPAQIGKFLNLDWQKGFLESRENIGKAIYNYTHSRLLDERSKFLMIYNIIEIFISVNRTEPEKFKLQLHKKQKNKNYNEAFDIIKKMVADEDLEELRKKWDSVKVRLEEKPIRGHTVVFLQDNNIDVDKLKIPLDQLFLMRNKIVHSSGDTIDKDVLETANRQLYKISAILILNGLGIKSWKFNYSEN